MGSGPVTACTTCWCASGGDAAHCGKCGCCPPSAALAPFGAVTVRREGDRVRITRADQTALISPLLIGWIFAGKAPHLRLDGDDLAIVDSFGKVVAYRIGEYVTENHAAGFALRREERTHYESHLWNPAEDADECAACGVAWQDCEDECSGVMP